MIDERAEDLFLNFVNQKPVNDHKDDEFQKSIKIKKRKKLNDHKKYQEYDFHGLRVNEAVDLLNQIFRNQKNDIVIIVGKGKHSEGLYSPLRITVEDFLDHNDLKYVWKTDRFIIRNNQ